MGSPWKFEIGAMRQRNGPEFEGFVLFFVNSASGIAALPSVHYISAAFTSF
jgi:hypothetical protein